MILAGDSRECPSASLPEESSRLGVDEHRALVAVFRGSVLIFLRGREAPYLAAGDSVIPHRVPIPLASRGVRSRRPDRTEDRRGIRAARAATQSSQLYGN